MDLECFQGKGCAGVARDFQGCDAVTKTRNKREVYVQTTSRNLRQERS